MVKYSSVFMSLEQHHKIENLSFFDKIIGKIMGKVFFFFFFFLVVIQLILLFLEKILPNFCV